MCRGPTKDPSADSRSKFHGNETLATVLYSRFYLTTRTLEAARMTIPPLSKYVAMGELQSLARVGQLTLSRLRNGPNSSRPHFSKVRLFPVPMGFS